MNIQILPNWFKKIALIIFIISTIIYSRDGFYKGYINGYNSASNNHKISMNKENVFYFSNLFGEDSINAFRIISALSLLAYIMSKEKIEDDYIKFLRLESYQISMFLIMIFGLLFLVLKERFFGNVNDVINVIMLLYLIIFFFKKRMA